MRALILIWSGEQIMEVLCTTSSETINRDSKTLGKCKSSTDLLYHEVSMAGTWTSHSAKQQDEFQRFTGIIARAANTSIELLWEVDFKDFAF